MHHGWLTDDYNNIVRWWTTRANHSINRCVRSTEHNRRSSFSWKVFFVFRSIYQMMSFNRRIWLTRTRKKTRAEIRLMNSLNNNKQMPTSKRKSNMKRERVLLCYACRINLTKQKRSVVISHFIFIHLLLFNQYSDSSFRFCFTSVFIHFHLASSIYPSPWFI